MIRLIEDIIPPDRPEETPAPKVRRAFPPAPAKERSEREESHTPRESERIDHELFERTSHVEEHSITDPPPYISRIPPREENKGTFLDRRPKERTPLHLETTSPTSLTARMRSYALPILAFLCVLAYLILSMTVFFRAKVVVTPKTERVVLNAHVTATKDAPSGLSFTVFSLTATETKDVLATETKTVSTKASGKILVYNEYSAVSQRLIKNTRFQAQSGKIYRISESIVVPGVTTVGGKTVPGRVEVTVYADEPGADYNAPLTDFTIPGFKGDPRFQKFYARSKTPMTGGFAGAMRVVADADLASAREEIETNLRAKLLKEAQNSVPKEFVLYDEGTYFVTRPLDRIDIEGSDNAVRLEESATLHAVMFPRLLLAQALAKDAVPNYDGAPVSVPDLDLLRTTITPKEESAWLEDELNLTLTGDTRIVWMVDNETIVSSLLGKKKAEFNGILAGIPAVEEARAEFRPSWWRGRFPAESKRIIVEVTDPSAKTP